MGGEAVKTFEDLPPWADNDRYTRQEMLGIKPVIFKLNLANPGRRTAAIRRRVGASLAKAFLERMDKEAVTPPKPKGKRGRPRKAAS